jgi:hypothetical protein
MFTHSGYPLIHPPVPIRKEEQHQASRISFHKIGRHGKESWPQVLPGSVRWLPEPISSTPCQPVRPYTITVTIGTDSPSKLTEHDRYRQQHMVTVPRASDPVNNMHRAASHTASQKFARSLQATCHDMVSQGKSTTITNTFT